MRSIIYKAGDAESHRKVGKFLQELKGGVYVVQIKKNRLVRSLSANRYYFAILHIIGIETGHTVEDLHEICKLKFNAEIIHFPKGDMQIVGKSTAKMDTQQFHGFINRVKLWAQEQFGIVIPEKEDLTQQTLMEIHNAYEENQIG